MSQSSGPSGVSESDRRYTPPRTETGSDMPQYAKPMPRAFGLATPRWGQVSVDIQCTGPYRLYNLEPLTFLLLINRYGITCGIAVTHEARILSSGGECPRKGANPPRKEGVLARASISELS